MIRDIGASTSTAAVQAASAPGGKLGKDEFLKMLVAQMRNQDPLSPMKSDEMAVQLAQFSSLEQLTNISSGLEDLSQVMSGPMLGSLHSASAMGVLGRTVLASGDLVELTGGAASPVTVDVGAAGGHAVLRLYDSSGREVGSRDLGMIGGGRQTLELGEAASGLAPGTYAYALEVTAADGSAVDVHTYVKARVDGVRYGAEGPILNAGKLRIPFGAIVEIDAP